MLAGRVISIAVIATIALSCVSRSLGRSVPTSDVRPQSAIIHAFENGLEGTRAGNPAVRLRVDADQSLDHEAVLLVEYPPPSSDPDGTVPAGRRR